MEVTHCVCIDSLWSCSSETVSLAHLAGSRFNQHGTASSSSLARRPTPQMIDGEVLLLRGSLMSRVRPWSLRNAGLPPRPAWAPEPVCRRPSSMAGLDCFAGAGGAPRHGPRRATLTLTRHRAATPPSVIQSICIAHAASDGCRRPGVDGISNTVHPLRPDEERCLRLTARLAGAPPSSGRLPLPSPPPLLAAQLGQYLRCNSAATLLRLRLPFPPNASRSAAVCRTEIGR